MKKLLLITSLQLIWVTAFAQADYVPDYKSPRRAKAIYVEALGSSGIGRLSINYDMRFRPGNRGWGLRVGVATPLQEGQVESYVAPILLTKVLSAKPFALEVGAGVSFLYRVLTFEDTNFQRHQRKTLRYPATANVGFRLQPARTGVVWRLYWAPSWTIGSSERPTLCFLGTSLGIGFH